MLWVDSFQEWQLGQCCIKYDSKWLGNLQYM